MKFETHRGSKDVVWATSKEEGFANFWVAVLRSRGLPWKKDILLENATLKKTISFNNVYRLNKYEGNIQIRTRIHRINDMMYSMCSWDLKIAIVCLFLLEKGRQEKVALKTLDHIGTILTHPGRSAKVSALQLVSFFDREALILDCLLHGAQSLFEDFVHICEFELDRKESGFCVLVVLAPFTQVPRHRNCIKSSYVPCCPFLWQQSFFTLLREDRDPKIRTMASVLLYQIHTRS